MSSEFQLLLLTAASLGFFHSIMRPDYYLPFVIIGKARHWHMPRTLLLTFICGLAHVVSSVIIGLIGVAIGLQIEKLDFIQSFRGNLYAWFLIAFGLIYGMWGLRHWYHNKKHGYTPKIKDTANITPWVLFLIFILGPSEVLVPILMYPAAHESTWAVILVSSVFGFTTLVTMLITVYMASLGLKFISFKFVEEYRHVIAGAVIVISGIVILTIGLR